MQLEPMAARRAAERAPRIIRTELDELASRVEGLDVAGADRSDVMRWDLTVHRAIYRAASNPHLEDVLIRYDNLATRIHCMYLDRLSTADLHVVPEHVALLRLEDSGIRVAQYVTELPPRELLEKKLHHAIRAARARLGTSSE